MAVFLDSAYLVAIIDPADQHHSRALQVGATLLAERSVTSEAVLIEFLTFLSGMGDHMRAAAVQYVDELRADSSVQVVSNSTELFDRGLALYRHRGDKTYSMTDCISMVICRERGITDVLTGDSDFVQEGFSALLRG